MSKKKVSIKLYLNDKVKPHKVAGIEHYPVYVRVTYDRKNTMFKLADKDGGGVTISKNLQNIDEYLTLENFFEKHSYFPDFQSLLAYELELVGEDNFQVKGFGDRVQNIYLQPVYSVLKLNDIFFDLLNGYLNEEKEIRKIWNATANVYNPFRLYHMAKFDRPELYSTIPDVHKQVVSTAVLFWLFCEENPLKIEGLTAEKWITGDYQARFLTFANSQIKDKPEAITDYKQQDFFDDFTPPFSNSDNHLNVINLRLKQAVMADM